LTARRLRAHALIFAISLWSVYAWQLSTPTLRDRGGNLKGTDFLHFYTLGLLANEHRGADLYDMGAQAHLAAQHVPEAAGIRYLPLYPPQVSLFFAPLARLPYGYALAVWWTITALLYGICCYAIWTKCPNLGSYGGIVALAALGYPAFFHLIAWGQTSALALTCFTGMFLLLRRKQRFLAGVLFGCLAFKPQLAMGPTLVLLLAGSWTLLAGAAVSAAAQFAVALAFYGSQPLSRWIECLRNTPALLPLLEPKPYQTHCLRTFWSMLVPWTGPSFVLYLLSAAAAIGIAGVIWRRTRETETAISFSALLLTSVLVAPHLTVYDLVILAPAILLLADRIVASRSQTVSRRLGIILYLIYALPLLGPLARWTHLQLSVIAMSVCLIMIREWSSRETLASPPAASF
jgi:alpha-1,2-mannosyltransferase